jgi:hypothetical protein
MAYRKPSTGRRAANFVLIILAYYAGMHIPRDLILPLAEIVWAVAGVLVVWGVFGAVRHSAMVRRIRSLRGEVCPTCTYALRDLPPIGVCPECGTPYDIETCRAHWREQLDHLVTKEELKQRAMERKAAKRAARERDEVDRRT